MLQSGSMLAGPVVVYCRSSDLSPFPSAYASNLASNMGVAINEEIPANNRSPGMQGGVKVGIAIGAVVAVAVFGGTLDLIRKRKSERTRRSNLLDMSVQSFRLKRLFHGNWHA